MVRIDLRRLQRRRTLSVAGAVPPDSKVWAGTGLVLAEPVRVTGTATLTGRGGVAVRGEWRSTLLYECGRCLRELPLELEGRFTLLFALEGSWEADDPDIRVIDSKDGTLDMQDAVREEIVLEAPRYHTGVEKHGRCTSCGDPVEKHRRALRAGRSSAETDRRWSALRALQDG